MDFFDAVMKRASYRGKYKQAPVPRNDLKAIIEAGLAAPSGCNLQTTHLVGVDDECLIMEIGALIGRKGFASATAGIVVFTTPAPAYHDNLYNVQDYSAAIENMLLAITSMGYASCWVEGYVTDDVHVAESIEKLLNAPDGWHAVAYLPVGVPEDEVIKVKKKPFEERAGFNTF